MELADVSMARVARLGFAGLLLAGAVAASCNSGKADPAGDALARGVAAQNAGKPEDAKRAYTDIDWYRNSHRFWSILLVNRGSLVNHRQLRHDSSTRSGRLAVKC